MILFFVIALAFTWALQLPALLASWGTIAGTAQQYLPLAGLGGFGPMIAALICTKREGLPSRSLFRAPRVAIAWYLLALLLSGGIYTLGAALYGEPLLFLPEQPQQWLAMLLVPLLEEPAWRGYAMPRLVRRFGALSASLWLGLAWSAWHLVMFSLQGMGPGALVWGLLHICAGGVLFGWLFQRTRGSVWVAIVAHVGAHLNNPAHALPDSTPLIVHAVATSVVAALLMLDREAWRSRDQYESCKD